MNRRLLTRRVVLAAGVAATSACATAPRAADVKSARAFVRAHPERAARLLARLNLDHPGLETVRRHHGAGDTEAAAEALARYYRKTTHGGWIKRKPDLHDPGGYENAQAMADEVLADIYTFQSVQGPAKRLLSGGVDWEDLGPRNDREWQFFLNRHFHLLPLIKAYAQSPDPAYAAYVDATIQDWVGATWPPAEAPRDRDLPGAWQPMSSASRFLQVWPQAFYSMQSEAAFSDAGRLMMLSSAPEQADHLLRYHRRRHNHAVKEMIGLSHAAAAWPEFADAPRWRAYALDVLMGELDHQFYPDGVQKELAAHYHHSVMTYFLQYVEFMRAAGFQPPALFEARIEAMGDYLAGAVRPDGYLPHNNDSDLDDVKTYLGEVAEVFGREDWRYIASNGATGERPAAPPSRFYPYAGQMISRSGWDERADWSFFDVGPWGISHQHNDRLHLSVVSGGRDLLVDTGRYVYVDDDPMRRYVVSSRGHNVIQIDGSEQGPQELESGAPLEGACAITDRFSVAFGAFANGFEDVAGHVVHRRAVAHVHGLGWIVADEIDTDRPRDIDARWHFHPDVAAVAQGLDVVSADKGVANIRITPVGLADATVRIARGESEPMLGWYSPKYNVKLPTSVALYSARLRRSAFFAWIITVDPSQRPSPVEAERLRAPEGVARLRVRTAVGLWEAAFRLSGEAPPTSPGGSRSAPRFVLTTPDGATATAL